MKALFLKIFSILWLAQVLLAVATTLLILRQRANDGGVIVRSLAANLHAEADEAVAQFERYGCTGATRVGNTYGHNVIIVQEDGHPLCSSLPDLRSSKENFLVEGVSGFRLSSVYAWRVGSSSQRRRYIVYLTLPVQSQSASERHDLRDFGLPQLPVLLVISAASAFLLVFLFTRPLRMLQEGSRAISSGDLSVRIRQRPSSNLLGNDAFQDVIRDFNHMAERLESLVSAHRLLLRDVSHELRSPLTRLNVALGLARKHQRSDAARHLDRIESESDTLNEMIAQLLSLSAMESAGAGEFRKFSLGTMIREMVPDAEYESGDRACSIALNIQEPSLLRGNPDLLHRAIWNVLRNAVQVSPPNAVVSINLARNAGSPSELEVNITDQGPGIAAADLEAIFRPFYRSDQARTPTHGGFGVGLAIAGRAIQLHHGRILATNPPEGGARFTIILPTGL